MSTPLRFSVFELRPHERRLLRQGHPVLLGSRAFDVLATLVEHHDRVVTKNELLDRVWAGLVVEEGNLKTQVSALRKVLGNDAIATVPGRGYRFALPVDGAATAAAASPAAKPSTREPVLFGRDGDVHALQGLLAQHRLVTITGAGGIGKTSVAMAASRASPGEAPVWTELAQGHDAASVPAALLHALGTPPSAGDQLERLVAALAQRQVLLVLDNAEHIAEAVAQVAQALLDRAGGVRILVTSQVPLGLRSERVYRLAPLPAPPPTATAEQARAYGAIALFVDRAQALDRHFTLREEDVPLVSRICSALDGLPLAIELAAARVPHLGLQGLADRLDDRLHVLGGRRRATPDRQQTLRAALDWSYQLLAPCEQAVFRRLSVFVGGFSLDTARRLAGAAQAGEAPGEWEVLDAIGALVDRSLVSMVSPHPLRYRLLESPRQYAAEQLQAHGESQACRRWHAGVFAQLAEQAAGALWTEPENEWLSRCEPELDNFRAALDWAIAHDRPMAVAMAGALGPVFECLSLLHEAGRRFAPLAEAPMPPEVPPALAARFLLARSRQLRDLPAERQYPLVEEAVRLCRAAGDAWGLYHALSAIADRFMTHPVEAAAALAEMQRLEQPDWPPALLALGKIAESKVLMSQGRLQENGLALEAAVPLAFRAGADRLSIVALANLADHVLKRGDIELALAHGHRLVSFMREQRKTAYLPLALANLANAQLQQGDVPAARRSLVEAIDLMRMREWTSLQGFGEVYALLAAMEGRHRDAARLLGWADEVRKVRGARQQNEAAAYERALRLLEGRLPDEERRRLAQGGARLGLPEAARAALGEGDPGTPLP